jgi:hypothetical protein
LAKLTIRIEEVTDLCAQQHAIIGVVTVIIIYATQRHAEAGLAQAISIPRSSVKITQAFSVGSLNRFQGVTIFERMVQVAEWRPT